MFINLKILIYTFFEVFIRKISVLSEAGLVGKTDGTEVPNATEESIFFSFDTGLTDCLADSLEFRDRDPR